MTFFFQVIIVTILVALDVPIEAFVSPHHGAAKAGLLLDRTQMTSRLNRHDGNVGIPLKYIHGSTNVDRALPVLEKVPPVIVNSGISLTTFLEGRPLESVFESLQCACRDISKLVRKASFGESNLSGLHDGGGSINIQGEEQKKLDVLANDIMKEALAQAGTVQTLASEEEEVPILLRLPNTKSSKKSYIVAFDPLDGSSNIDVGIPVGTIFGIFEHTTDGEHNLEEVLQPGRKLVGAGYCLYSAATTLVITLGEGVYGFTLDETSGEFVLTHPYMKIPSRGSIYSFNEGNRWDWDLPVQNYITNIQKGQGETQSKYSGRLVGSMVADIHRTLQYGGIFGYPATSKNPNGKLRLLYEAAPMSFIVEQAGGLGSTGTSPLMNVQPTHIHQRVPCILGSRDDVKELESYYPSNQLFKKAKPFFGAATSRETPLEMLV